VADRGRFNLEARRDAEADANRRRLAGRVRRHVDARLTDAALPELGDEPL
jgi:hypothetical protein